MIIDPGSCRTLCFFYDLFHVPVCLSRLREKSTCMLTDKIAMQELNQYFSTCIIHHFERCSMYLNVFMKFYRCVLSKQPIACNKFSIHEYERWI